MLKKLFNKTLLHKKEIILYVVSLLLTFWIMERLLKLRHSNFWSIPFGYGGDALIYSYIIKAVVANGWFWTNESLGMPFGMLFRDYPYPDNIQFFFIRIIGWFTGGNYARALNLFYLFTYPLTTICAVYAVRQFGISYIPAVIVGLLYNFSYYHFHRGIHHMMYGTYYMVPLMVMALLWIMTGRLKLKTDGLDDEAKRVNKRRMIIAIAISIFVGGTGCAYYPFFAVVLLLIISFTLVFRLKNVRAAALPVIFGGIIFGTLLLNVAPTLLFRWQHGSVELGKRVPWESELYGLKVIQVLLPINEHRIKKVAKFREKYNVSSPVNTENGAASIGFIGSLGFLSLIGGLFFYRKTSSKETSLKVRDADSPLELWENLSILNGWAILVATIGGLGTLFAWFISPQIRSYNRISAYIAFFALFAVALFLDFILKNYCKTKLRRGLYYCAAVVLLFFGILDQTPKNPAVDYEGTKVEFEHDKKFYSQIESVMPNKAMIFQLPLFHFPEDMSTSHMRGYLQSDKLRWSFGAMKERENYTWQEMVSSKPVPEMIKELALVNFSGIFLDRTTPKPLPASLEQQISEILSQKPMVSPNGRLVFFNLIDYRKKLIAGMSKEQLAKQVQYSLNPLIPVWQKGFYSMEGTPDHYWRWCDSKGEIIFENKLNFPRQVNIKMAFNAPSGGSLRIGGDIITENLHIPPSADIAYTKSLTIPPGKHIITLECDAQSTSYPPDIRKLNFLVRNFSFDENAAIAKEVSSNTQ